MSTSESGTTPLTVKPAGDSIAEEIIVIVAVVLAFVIVMVVIIIVTCRYKQSSNPREDIQSSPMDTIYESSVSEESGDVQPHLLDGHCTQRQEIIPEISETVTNSFIVSAIVHPISGTSSNPAILIQDAQQHSNIPEANESTVLPETSASARDTYFIPDTEPCTLIKYNQDTHRYEATEDEAELVQETQASAATNFNTGPLVQCPQRHENMPEISETVTESYILPAILQPSSGTSRNTELLIQDDQQYRNIPEANEGGVSKNVVEITQLSATTNLNAEPFMQDAQEYKNIPETNVTDSYLLPANEDTI